jgi:hypothetical protein
MARVEVGATGCWIWTGAKQTAGYGVVNVLNRQQRVHRLMYEVTKGEIPDGLFLDHLCRTPACCNPDHLEPVTHDENIRRAVSTEYCKRGHRLDLLNTALHSRPNRPVSRQCKQCNADGQRRRRALALAEAI